MFYKSLIPSSQINNGYSTYTIEDNIFYATKQAIKHTAHLI